MKFAYLYFLLAIPLIAGGGVGLYRWALKNRIKKLGKFSPPSRLSMILRSVDDEARRRKAWLLLAGVALLFIALARPLLGPKDDTADQVGAEFYFILDVSRSMQVRDVEPDRLQAVKDSLGRWVKKRVGDRIGLILVAGDAFVQAPLTSDYTALNEVLQQSGPWSISQGGTKLPAAMTTAVKALKDTEQRQKVVVIISDGENLKEDPFAFTRQARAEMDNQITFYTVGVGTPEGGKVPKYDFRKLKKKDGHFRIDFKKPPRRFVKDEYGIEVTSRLQERALRQIAMAGGGSYFEFDPKEDTWDLIYEQAIKPLATKVDKLNLQDYTELFQIPLFLALLLLAYEISISTRRAQPAKIQSVVSLPETGSGTTAAAMDGRPLPKPKGKPPVKIFPLLIMALCFSLGQGTAVAADLMTAEEAEKLVLEGKAADAAAALRAITQNHPDDPFAVYNYGIACYAAGQFLEASTAFEEVSRSEDKELRALASAQLGNAQFRLGEALLSQRNKEGAVLAWERAVDRYQESNDLKSSRQARHNLELVGEKYKELLIEIGKARLDSGRKMSLEKGAWMRAQALAEAVDRFQQAVDFDPKDKQVEALLNEAKKEYAETLATMARNQREKAYAAGEEAEALARKATAENNEKKKKQIKKQEWQARREENEARAVANENYEQALNVLPEDKALQKEFARYQKEQADPEVRDAEAFLGEADEIEERNARKALREQEKLLAKASEKVDRALELDPDHQRARELKKETQQRQEENFMAQARAGLEHAKEVAEKAKERSLGSYNAAAEDFRQAKELNPENREAEKGLEEAEKGLAEAYEAAGQRELEKAEQLMAAAEEKKAKERGMNQPPSEKAKTASGKDAKDKAKVAQQKDPSQKNPTAPTDAPGKQQAPGEQDIRDLQQQIGHLEKAAQNFAQAEAVDPGATDAAQKESQATEQLNEIRNQLDQALSQAQATAQASSQPPDESSSGNISEKKEPSDWDAVQILSFSEIRRPGSSSGGDFSDNSDDSFVRDW